MIYFKLHCNTARRLVAPQTFAVLDVGVVLVKCTENNAPSIKITNVRLRMDWDVFFSWKEIGNF